MRTSHARSRLIKPPSALHRLFRKCPACGKMTLKTLMKNKGHCNDCGQFKMKYNRDCSTYLGVHVAERALRNFFVGIHKMPINNPGYDFICGKNFKIDVKSSCLRKVANRNKTFWGFGIGKNLVADYFLCLAFDNRDDLNPLHVWLIPGHAVNQQEAIRIGSKSPRKWQQYEKPIDKVITACETMRGGDKVGSLA